MPPSARRVQELRAFREIYCEQYGFVWHTVRRFGVPTREADDAVQDTFVAAYRRLEDYVGPNPRPWLYGIARRVASNYRRSAGRRHRKTRTLADRVAASGPEECVVLDLHVLDAFLQHLQPVDRELFVLAEIEGMTGREITAALRIRPSTAYDRIRRLRARLHEQLAGTDPQQLLDCARRERPEATRRTWAAIVPLLQPPVSQVAAATALAYLQVGGVVAVLGVGLVATAAVTSPGSLDHEDAVANGAATRHPPRSANGKAPPDPDATATVTTLDAALASPGANASALVSSPAPATGPPPAEKMPLARAAPPRTTEENRAAPPLVPSLSDDTRLLREASQALADQQPAQALRLVEQHARDFRSSALADVRLALRVEALCALDRPQEARAIATSFSRMRPQSPVAARIEKTCAGTGNPRPAGHGDP